MIKSKPPDPWWVKIGDFGISKRTEDDKRPSTVKGTLEFMAPELKGMLSQENVERNDCAADIWSLGEITYQLLTAKPTFANFSLLYGYVQGAQSFPDTVLDSRGITSIGQDFIRSMMSISPETRVTALHALGHNWLHHCQAEPIQELPPPTAPVRQVARIIYFHHIPFIMLNH